ncbi:hypothetical protein [Brevibacillus sp. SYSU BS000544]|uniref:hypothetical protein n=1 Tax=Brevibacillus sp. SYSU BS000544 TaxID=3416443 RepID=UPI003CE50953
MKIKLLFASHNFIFLQDVISLFQKHPDFDVKLDKWIDRTPNENSKILLNWADVIIVNYVLAPAVWYSQHKKPNQTLIIRYHRFEIETEHPKMLEVKNIDKLVSTSPIFQSRMENLIGLSKHQSVAIYNPINIQKFQLNKNEGSEFHLGMLGYSVKIKRADRAFEIFEKLKQHDSRYKLFFKGPTENERPNVSEEARRIMDEIHQKRKNPLYQDSVFFDQEGPDVPEWFRNIGFILSMSEFESFHCSLAEGMASGCIPMIIAWPGANLIYPEEFISADIDEIVQKILMYSQNKELFESKQEEVIDYCLENFSHHVIFDQFLQHIFDCLATKARLRKQRSPYRKRRIKKPRFKKTRLRTTFRKRKVRRRLRLHRRTTRPASKRRRHIGKKLKQRLA